MKNTKNIRNAEYRIFEIGANQFEVWLVSFASGAKLFKASQSVIFKSKVAALEFIDWVKEQEEKYLSK